MSDQLKKSETSLEDVLRRIVREEVRAAIEDRINEDKYLTAEEVAQRMGCSVDYVYRRELPFRVKEGRLLRFSEKGLYDYLKQRQQNGNKGN